MCDLVVMGAGIFGLACAFACARRGARVCVVDPGGPGAGASGGIVGALAPHAPEAWTETKAFQLDALLMADAFWAEVAEVAGIATGFARTGRLQPLPDAAAVARAHARATGAATLWQGRATWSVIPAAEAPGWPGAAHIVPETGLLAHDTLSARIDPARACRALARAVERLGGRIAATPPGPAAATLWATGHAGLADLSAAFARPVGSGVKGQALRLHLPDADPSRWPQLFAGGLHIVPHADGALALGSTTERDFTDPSACDAQADALLDRARALVPCLARARITARWAGVRPRTRSRAPLLGPWPGRPGHFIANGGFKIGVGLAPKVAAAMADLILTGRSDIPAGFAPEALL